MRLDHLLVWLSAKGEGSWSQFRGAVEELDVEQGEESPDSDDEGEQSARGTSDLAAYQRVRLALQRLGHVEFFANEVDRRWRVVPPTVALFPASGGDGLLCGARSPDLLEALGNLDNVEVTGSAAPGMPQRILLRAISRNVVAAAARRLGFHVQADAPMAILSATPAVRDSATWYRGQLPETPGWIVHRFSPSRLAWAKVAWEDARAARAGLFRFVMGHQRFHYLRWRGESYSVPVQVGKYAVMRRRRDILAYNAATQVLSVPAACRPPLLIERALVLCSGFLPRFDQSLGRVEYASVLPDVARLSAELLQQEVR